MVAASSVVRWLLPLFTPLMMFCLEAVFSHSYQERVLQKGEIAPFTIRADSDAVFDLHETRAAEAAEAKLASIPIYDKDNQVFYRARTSVLEAALARPIEQWSWPPAVAEFPGGDGGVDGETTAGSADAMGGGTRDLAAEQKVRRADESVQSERDGGEDGRATGSTESESVSGQATSGELVAERTAELEALVRGCFRLLEPFFKRGVVADTEFPHEKRTVRLLADGRYTSRRVARLHRFSELRPALQRGARQFFFKSDARVRAEVIDFVLQRLPANVSYSQENDRFIADMSQVTGLKVVLIHRGAILAGRGDTIDTRAHYAIRASVAAARETSWLERQLGRFGLVGALLLLLGLVGRSLCTTVFERPRSLLFVHGAILVLFVGAKLLLLYWPIQAALLPQVSVALIAAVLLGRATAVLVAVALSTSLALTLHFDLTGIIVGVAGGVTAALVVRPRRRLAVLAAGVLVGLAQALAVEACRAAAGQPQQTPQLWAAGQAFIGGLLCGPVALVGLPFVQRWLGHASRGSLETLVDFDHPLLRRLRERLPEVFAHSVRVMNLADAAVEAVGGDRLLTRAGALLHDIGKLEAPDDVLPGSDDDEDQGQRRLRRQRHVEVGLRLAQQFRLPAELLAFIGQHLGTLPLDFGTVSKDATGRFACELPASIEVSAVMLANRVARVTRLRPDQAAAETVEQVMVELIQQRQLVRCPVSTAQLDQMGAALVHYLEEHR